ncbi:MAG: ABC transporter permease [Bacteroidales bacterium]|nr:ABC transporter permease [Bacteroidales bacterium]
MNVSYFLSRKLIPKDNSRISRPVVIISIIGVALGVSILIIALAITTGFKNEIREKIIGFGTHIEISRFDNNNSYESAPVYTHLDFYNNIKNLDNVLAIQAVATKAGIVRGENDIEGVVFKGVGKDYHSSFFEKHLLKGHFIQLQDSLSSDEIIISELLANKLHLDTGQRLLSYFVQNPVRQRVFKITGIYNTGLGSYDKHTVIADIRQIQHLNNWDKTQASAVEVLTDDFENIDTTNKQINDLLPHDMQATTIMKRNQDIFDWINLFNQNVYILIILIVIITTVSLISTQLTISLEHITTIGILKTLGCTNTCIRDIFLYISLRILGFGLLFGNAVAFIICYLQSKFDIIRLNPENYYVSSVPIEVVFWQVLLINTGAVIICMGILILPSYFVAKKTKAITALRMD